MWYNICKISEYLQPADWGYWLDPNGKLIQLGKTHGHIDAINQIGIRHYQEAFQKGYVRIVTENRELHVNKGNIPLTSIQIRTLNYMSKNYDFYKWIIDDSNGYEEFKEPMSFNKYIKNQNVV